jgi:outer membrane protein OmpA-like peptidoglycan-associated protein
MRVSAVLASLCVACGVAHAEGTSPPAAAPSGIVVNMDALPTPLPRPKPSAEDLRPLAQVHPRFKPAPETIAAAVAPDDVVVAPSALPAPVALPRFKPAREVAALEPQPAVARPVPLPVPAPTTPPPAAPVTIVTAPTVDTSIGVEIRGVAQDLNKPTKPFNPTEGFAVLSRVRFSTGKTDLPRTAQPLLDSLVQRLQTSQERVRLAAFSGKAGDLSSDARRLSLARAIAIRSYLVSRGIAVDRVDVLAFGGATDGIGDRVDVLVRGI